MSTNISKIADVITALINSQMRSPTKAEIEAALADHLGPNAHAVTDPPEQGSEFFEKAKLLLATTPRDVKITSAATRDVVDVGVVDADEYYAKVKAAQARSYAKLLLATPRDVKITSGSGGGTMSDAEIAEALHHVHAEACRSLNKLPQPRDKTLSFRQAGGRITHNETKVQYWLLIDGKQTEVGEGEYVCTQVLKSFESCQHDRYPDHLYALVLHLRGDGQMAVKRACGICGAFDPAPHTTSKEWWEIERKRVIEQWEKKRSSSGDARTQ